MSKTVDQIRAEANITWPEFFRLFKRGKTGRERIKKYCQRKLPGGWLFEIGASEALRRAANLQTDIEDFVPTTQRPVQGASAVLSVSGAD